MCKKRTLSELFGELQYRGNKRTIIEHSMCVHTDASGHLVKHGTAEVKGGGVGGESRAVAYVYPVEASLDNSFYKLNMTSSLCALAAEQSPQH